MRRMRLLMFVFALAGACTISSKDLDEAAGPNDTAGPDGGPGGGTTMATGGDGPGTRTGGVEGGGGAGGATDGDGGRGTADEGGAGDGGVGGDPTGGDPPATLLAAVGTFTTSWPGGVLVCELDAGGGCSLLEPIGLGSDPQQALYVDDRTIVVLLRDRITAIDPVTELVKWSSNPFPFGERAYALFELVTPLGGAIGVALGSSQHTDVEEVRSYSLSGAHVSTVTLPTARAMAAGDPTMAGTFFTMGGSTLLERVDISGGSQPIIWWGSSRVVENGYVLHDGQRLRASWVTGTTPVRVANLNPDDTVTDNITCQMNFSPCAPRSLVPDPTTPNGMLATCTDFGVVRRELVVRLGPDSTDNDACVPVVDVTTYDADAQLRGLSIRR
ncbi:MAG: hypothetical protein AAGA56_11515 [Myxococcota bacterium]